MRFPRLSAVLFASALWLPVQAAGQLLPLSEVFPVWWQVVDSEDPFYGPIIPGVPVVAALRPGFAAASVGSTLGGNVLVAGGKLVDLSGQPGPAFTGERLHAGNAGKIALANPAIAATRNGELVLAWLEWEYPAASRQLSDWHLHYRRFGPGGAPLEEVRGLASAAALCAPAIAANPSGGFAIAWESGQGCGYAPDTPFEVFIQAFQPSGKPAGSVHRTIPVHKIRVGIDASGRFVAIWRQAGATPAARARLCGQSYDAAGHDLGSPFCAGELAGTTGGALAVDPAAGRFLAAWFGPAAGGVQTPLFVRRYRMNGTPLGSPIQVATATRPDQLAASADGHGNTALSWLEGDQMRVLLVRRDAVAKGPAIVISGVESDSDSETRGAALADSGRLLVTWRSGGQILGRLWQAGW
jgi:hypothetical protein